MSLPVLRPFVVVTICAIIIRVILLIYAEWQDKYLEVKYTDVDYWVFSDSASAMLNGKSPFTRPTYRYTPLLAAMLIPNSFLGNLWGKALFCVYDLFSGYFIYLFLIRNTSPTRAAKITAILWSLNPMVFTISTRGNAESVMSFLILSSMYTLVTNRFAISGLLFGISVHFKLFPVIYGVAILSYLFSSKYRRTIESPATSPKLLLENLTTPASSPASSPGSSPPTNLHKRNKNKWSSVPGSPLANRSHALSTPRKVAEETKITLINRFENTLIFAFSSILSFGCLTYFFYKKYGFEYLNEAILFHLIRKDHRHNFSPYFYLFYTERLLPLPTLFEVSVFVPQILFFFLAGLKFGKKDLPFACFIITFVFVTFNKVITSQVRSIFYPCFIYPGFSTLFGIFHSFQWHISPYTTLANLNGHCGQQSGSHHKQFG